MSAQLYCTCTNVFPPAGRADDHDIIRWCHCCYAYIEVRGLYKGVCTSPRALIWVFGCSTFSYTSLGATDPLLQLPWCLSRSEIIALQGSVLYLFDCKCPSLSWVPWVSLLQLVASNWVTCHPVSITSCIRVAGTAIFWCRLAHAG